MRKLGISARELYDEFAALQARYRRLSNTRLEVRQRLRHGWLGAWSEGQIEISRSAMKQYDTALVTLLHECAHALANVYGHTSAWKRWFRRLLLEHEFERHGHSCER